MRHSKSIITVAVERLSRILPLTANQHALAAPHKRLHRAILHGFINQGRMLHRQEMAQYVANVDAALNALKQNHLIVCNNTNEPTGAYPFTLEERIHQVSANGHKVHCMCALDALAVSPMFSTTTTITSNCHLTKEPITITQHELEIQNQTDVSKVCFGINWNAASENTTCAESLCTEMIFLKNDFVAEEWVGADSEQRQLFQLQDAIEFAARFFVPLIKEA